MRYAVGCDHAGLSLKAPLVAELEARGHAVDDFGTHGPESVDYPRYAARVACAVRDARADMGLLLCGTGLGMAVTANRFDGVRAVTVSEPFSARMARAHNDANVLCMGARVVGPGLATEILGAWLDQEFEGGRHQRRVDMMMHPGLDQEECAAAPGTGSAEAEAGSGDDRPGGRRITDDEARR